MAFIRAILYYLTISLALCLVGVPYLLIRGGLFGQWIQCMPICIPFFEGVFKIFGIKLNVVGKENIPPEGNFVLVANHQSFLDINVLWPSVSITSFIAKGELWKIPIFGWVLNRIGCIPVDKNPRKNANMGKLIVEHLKKGHIISVFPEGHRSSDGRMLNFQNGIFRMAKENKFNILPVTLIDTGKRLYKSKTALVPGTVTVVIHPLVKPQDYENKTIVEFRDEVRSTIESAMPYAQKETLP
ncbi:MAG: 1-acyl-sn-glycerol-3-phosphate acyltransferase [Fibrobacter sp.]|nr:1-acyl-sn-glycerol-3-phosphate acyltransferase [Fibrobacter sp.]